MSHHLILYNAADRTDPNESKILEVLDRLPHTKRNGERGDFQYLYENRETGVEFSVEYRDPRRLVVDDEVEYHFDGVAPSGVSVSLSYLRPSFFGLEAMPWVQFVAQGLGLSVLDPQGEGGSAVGPVPADTEALFDSWDAANTRATQTLLSQEGIDLANGDRERLHAWWRYRMARSELEQRYRESHAVLLPRLVHDASGRVFSVVSWPYGAAAVLPADVDYLRVERQRRKFGILRVLERGVIDAEAFRRVAAIALDRVDEPFPHAVFDPSRLGDAERLTFDKIAVDVRSRFQPVVATRLSDVQVVARRA